MNCPKCKHMRILRVSYGGDGEDCWERFQCIECLHEWEEYIDCPDDDDQEPDEDGGDYEESRVDDD